MNAFPKARPGWPGCKSNAARHLLAASMISATLACNATVIRWAGTGNGNWNDSSKWSPNQVPSTNDTAVITNAGTYTVTLNINPVIAGLRLGGAAGAQTLAIASHTLTLNGNAAVGVNGVVLLNGGGLAGTGEYDLQGTLNWSHGELASNTVVNVATGGRCDISSGANYTKILSGTLANSGTVAWKRYGHLLINGTLHNQSGGLFDLLCEGYSIQDPNGTGSIVNDGLIQKTNGVAIVTCHVPIDNRGTIDIRSGTLTLPSGGALADGCAFTGAGKTQLNGGTNTLGGGISSENLHLLYDAILAGTGSVSGTMVWSGGTIGADADITIATDGFLSVSSSANYSKVLNGTLANAGCVAWRLYGHLLVNGTFHNLPAGVLDLLSEGYSIHDPNGTGSIVNDGLIQKTNGVAIVTCHVPVDNRGTIDIRSGTLTLPSGGALADGCAFTGAGKTQLNGGTNTLVGGIYSENLHLLHDATLAGTGSVSGTMVWSGGTIGAGADITIATDGTLLIASSANQDKLLDGALANAGTVAWQPHGQMQIGGTLHNLPGSVFDAQNDARSIYDPAGTGLIINDGLFQKTNGTGTIVCYAAIVNNGTVGVSAGKLEFQGGFANPAGTIALAGGNFQSAEPLCLSGGLLHGWGTVYNAVTNAASVKPSRTGGLLSISGDYVQKMAGATIFELGGNQPGVNQGRLNVSGTASLAGCINVEWAEGYLLGPGTNFTVMAFASRSGAFDCQNGFFLLGQDRRLESVYAPASLTLASVAAPDPTAAPLGVSAEDGTVMVAWPHEFTGYGLYCKTNLNQSEWMPVAGASNPFMEPAANKKFFRLATP